MTNVERRALSRRAGLGHFWTAIILVILLTTGTIAYSSFAEYKSESASLLSQAQSIAITLGQAANISSISDGSQEVNSKSYTYLRSLLSKFDATVVGKINSVYVLGQRTDASVYFYVGSASEASPDGQVFGTNYDEASGALKNVFSSGTPGTFIERNQWGNWIAAATPLRSASGQIVGVLGVVSSFDYFLRDVILEVAIPGLFACLVMIMLLIVLRKILTKQQDIAYQRTVFVTTTFHDIRSPLSGMLWALKLMRQPEADLNDLITKMDGQLKYATQLVDDVFGVVRADLELDKFKKTKQDITKLLAQTIESQKINAEQYDVKIKTDFPNELIVRVDEKLFKEVASNLISNAIKYTKTDTTILVKVWQMEKYAFFSVMDEGDGISEADKKHLFEPFFRSESAKQSGRPGTGMGLSLVKEIVDRHKGIVKVASHKGKGSTFTVRLRK
jgi:signal transduction histidine kinase